MGTFSGGKKGKRRPCLAGLSSPRLQGGTVGRLPQSPHPSQTPATASMTLGTHCSPALEPITWRYIRILSLKQVKEKRIAEITVTTSLTVKKYDPQMRDIRPERSQLSFDKLDVSRNSNCPKSKVCPSLSICHFPRFEMLSEKFPESISGSHWDLSSHSHFRSRGTSTTRGSRH